LPKYDFACPECGAYFESERPMVQAVEPANCPVCETESRRVFTMPKLIFKADPRDVRPTWRNHNGYSHQHAPRRGRHRTQSEDH
jgi:putative FmdB family regulatory protein